MEKENTQSIEETKPKHSLPYKIFRAFLFLIIFAVALFCYARYISTSGLIVKEYQITSEKLPSHFDGLKIVHFTDLHYQTTIKQPELKKIVNKINELKPDIVIFTGDLLDRDHILNEKQQTELITELKKINASLFKYAVSGNHDYTVDNFQEIYEESGFIYLNNERKDIYYEGIEPISIYGFPSSISDAPDYSILNTENQNFKIAILHEPDSVDNILVNHPDLILAGHSHGGQIRLPFIGVLYTSNGSKKYNEAYYDLDTTDLYISSGLGTSTIKLRFFNRPSINLYRLYSN